MGKYDAVVVGSGPNGLAAAITLQRAGLSVLLLEAAATAGGGMRTAPLTLPGFLHDVCSAIHPMAAASPFFKSLPLREYGLEYIHPPVSVAHPFDDGPPAVMYPSLTETAAALGEDQQSYHKLFDPLIRDWEQIQPELLAPLLSLPRHPLALARFGIKALHPARSLAAKYFKTKEARGLWAGIAAHSMLPLSAVASSAPGLVLGAVGHLYGWPLVKGGSQRIADAMAAYFLSLGGKMQTHTLVRSLTDLPEAKAILFDTSPRQLVAICGDRLSRFYRWQISRFRYGMGVFKTDWALSSPIPFRDEACRKAGTVHLGGTFEDIALSEDLAWNGRHAGRPFVLVAQQSLFDENRAPQGCHTGWAYCHVPLSSRRDMTDAIEAQVERFAPGFKDTILTRHTYNTEEIQHYNANYVGGDISGGVMNMAQLFSRPALRGNPYRTSAKGIYICSASAPPGGGVHGMCGYHAARAALKDVFGVRK